MSTRAFLRKRVRRLFVTGAIICVFALVAIFNVPQDTIPLVVVSCLSLFIAFVAIEYSVVLFFLNSDQMLRIEKLLTRIAHAVAPVEPPKIEAVGIAGNWHVELDDGTGADRSVKIGGSADLKVGEILYKAAAGRDWRIDRVEPDQGYAHAVPQE